MKPHDLEAALTAWREVRHPDLAAHLRDRSRPRDVAAWDWEVSLGDTSPAGTARLALAFDRGLVEGTAYAGRTADVAVPVLHADLFRRVAALRERCPDPRVADAALRVLTAGLLRPHVWGAPGALLVYGPVVELLVAAGDPSLADAVEALGHKPLSRRPAVREALAALLPAAAERLRAIPTRPVPPELASAVARTSPRSRLPSRGAAELWAELVADPANTEILAVLGDAWIEAGDPRGAIVALERQGGNDKQVRASYRAHSALWLGTDLGAVLAEAQPRGGVLVEATLLDPGRAGAQTWAAALRDERTATLRALRASRGNPAYYRSFLASPLLRALREADGVDEDTLDTLARREVPSLEVLGQLPSAQGLAPRLASGAGLAGVRSLRFCRRVDVYWLVDSLNRAGVAPRIQSIELGLDRILGTGAVFGPTLDEFLPGFSDLVRGLPNLQRLVGAQPPLWFWFERRDDGWHAEVELARSRWQSAAARALPQVRLPAEIVSVRVRGEADPAVRNAIRAAVARDA